MISLSPWRYRWRAAFLIQQRDLRSMVFGLGMYGVLGLSMLAATLILRNYLNFVNEKGLLVLSGAFTLPLFAAVFLSSLFLALSSVTTIARERDQGTMEVLFYGPVDGVSYILGKYLAHIVVYLMMVVVYGVGFVLYAGLTNFTFPPRLIWVLLLSILVTSDVVAFGMFLSTLSRTVRAALLLFLAIVLVFVVIQAGHTFLTTIPIQDRYYNPVLFLKNAFSFLNQVAGWLSPFSYLNQGLNAVGRGSGTTYLVMLVISAAYTVVFLGLSVVALERKGVRK